MSFVLDIEGNVINKPECNHPLQQWIKAALSRKNDAQKRAEKKAKPTKGSLKEPPTANTNEDAPFFGTLVALSPLSSQC